MRRQSVVALGLAAAVGGAVVPALAATTGATTSTTGNRTCFGKATAHYAGGVRLSPQPGGAPTACGTSTGFASAESHVVKTRKGAVIFTPAVIPSGAGGTDVVPVPISPTTQSNAAPAGLAITTDAGASWKLVKPLGITWNPTDHGDYVDPMTGRIFFEDYGPIPLAPQAGPLQEGPAHINWSNDEGATWHHTSLPGMFLPENPRFASARAPVGQAQPVGYPKVTYFCANTNVGFTSPAIAGRVCYRSLDGGSKWQKRALLFTGTAPQHPECGSNGEQYSAIDGNYPQPIRSGVLFVMVTCGGTTYLARSDDEAGSFPIIHRGGQPLVLPVPQQGTGSIGGGADLRTGPDDTMYLMYQVDNNIILRVSRDLGMTWSKEFKLNAPGVTGVLKWTMAAGGPDQISVAYLGHRTGETVWDGYVTATHAATSGLSGTGPVFWSGRINSPSRPLLFGDGVQGAGYITLGRNQQLDFPPPFSLRFAGNDFIGATMDFDGFPWGSFTQDCGPTPESAGCVATNDQTRGYAGYLRWGG
ncbi:MAG: hypothetical protein QOG53_1862 [Frankiales bacterium]|jgi:hypothetical protein|nr:hypothetical protein [Frankiales bacterium]